MPTVPGCRGSGSCRWGGPAAWMVFTRSFVHMRGASTTLNQGRTSIRVPLCGRSVILTAPQPRQDGIYAAARICPVGDRVERLTGGGDPRNQHIEVEVSNEREAPDIGVAIAGAGEHHRNPFALPQVDAVACEQAAVLPAVPEEGGCTAGVARRGNQ